MAKQRDDVEAAVPGVAGESPERLEPGTKAVVIAVMIAYFMVGFDATILVVALDTLASSFDASLGEIQWVITGYLLALIAGLPLSGWLASKVGGRRVYIASLLLFTAGALLCGVASSTWQLIAFRALQGLGAGLLGAVGQSILVHTTKSEQLPKALSLIGIPVVAAPVFGPLVGGVIADSLGWRWIFLANVPFGLIALALAMWTMPRTPRQEVGRLDFFALVLACGGLSGITYALASMRAAGSGGGRTVAVICLIVGLSLLASFVVRSNRSDRPLLPVHLLGRGAFGAASLAAFLVNGVQFGGILIMPLYYQNVRGLSPDATGLLLMFGGVGAAVGTLLAPRLIKRYGLGATAVAGAVVGVLATAPFVLMGSDTSYYTLSVALAVRGSGIALMLITFMTLAYRQLPRTEVNGGTAQYTATQRLGAATGTVLVASWIHAETQAAGAEAVAPYSQSFVWVLVAGLLAVPLAIYLTISARRAVSAE